MILRLIFYAVVFYAIYYALKGLFGSISKQMGGGRAEGEEIADDEMVACPECGTYFPTGIGVPRRLRRENQLLCGEECAQKFAERGGPPPEESPPGG